MSKQDVTLDGMRVFERIEKGLKRLVRVIEKSAEEGMMDTCQKHRLQSRAMELFYGVQGLHCELTHVAHSNDCDTPTPPDEDDGGVIVQGGPGR